MSIRHINLFKTVVLTLFLALSTSAHAGNSTLDLPDMGDSSATILSADDDKRLGEAFMRSIRRQATIIDDPAVNTYVNALGYQLLAGAQTELPFTFFVVDAPSINAFAGPGGYIGIHSGLILSAETEGELASVLAHEIAHVTQRHLARAFKKASASSMQVAAAVLAAIILGNPEVGEAAIALAMAAPLQQQLNFTRQHEKEADRVGIDILANAGYDPRNMPAFFQRLQQNMRYMENGLPELLRTHPVTPSRISDSSNRAEQYSPQKSYISNQDFALIQARLHTLGSEKDVRLQTLQAAAKQHAKLSTAEGYELALWQLNESELEAAHKTATTLLAESPEHPLYISLMATIEMAQGKATEAESRLTHALTLYPMHAQLTIQLVETLLRQNKTKPAANKIRELIQHLGDFTLPEYYRLLAKAETAAGLEGNAYLAMAEYYYQIGETRVAIDQLESALNKTGEQDTFNRAKIEARLRELKGVAIEEKNLEAP